MLFSGLIGALALGASIVKGVPAVWPSSQLERLYGSSTIAKFDQSLNTIDRYQPTFTRACQENQPHVLVNGLVDIHSSISALGARTDVLVQLDVNTLAGKTLHLMVKLQVLLRIIDQHGMISTCTTVLVQLKSSLQILVSVMVSVHIDIAAKSRTLGTGVDFGFYARVGIDLDLGAQGTIEAGVAVGAGVGEGGAEDEATAKLIAAFQVSTGVMTSVATMFKTACEQRNVYVIFSVLATIKASLAGLEVNANSYARIGVRVLTTNALSVFVKLQVLLRLISDNSLGYSCHDSIVPLQGALKAIISAAVHSGIDVSTTFSAAVDLQLFARVGLSLDFAPSGGFRPIHGGGVRPVYGAPYPDVSGRYFVEFKESIAVIDNFAPQFNTACIQRDVASLDSGFYSIAASITTLSQQTNELAHVNSDELWSHFFRMLTKLQAILRLIARYNLVSSCHRSISYLQAPLKVFVKALVSSGVDVSDKVGASDSLDLSSFSSVGINLGIQATNSFNPSSRLLSSR